MGVFLYSNGVVNNPEKVKSVFVTRGHKDVISVPGVKGTLIRANKILIENHNYLSGKELGGNSEDFIVGIGTYIYNGKFGDAALKEVWDNLEIVLRDNPIYGHWAFVIHKNDATYVFNDMNGVLRLFYVVKDDMIVISSSQLGVIASMDNPVFDKVRLAGFLDATSANEISFVKGVESVNPQKILRIKDDGEMEWLPRTIPPVKRIDTLDDAVSYVRNLFREQTDQLKAIGEEKVSMDCTGGLDSRLITANLKTAGFNFDYINYPIFGPDKEIADILSKGLGKVLHIQTNIPIQNNVNEHFGEFDFGDNYYRQYPNPRWKAVNRIEFTGALGECISTPLSVKCMNNPTLKNLVESIIFRGESNLIREDYKKLFNNYVIDFLKDRGFESDKYLTEGEVADFEQVVEGQFSSDMFNSACQAHEYFYNIYEEWHFNHFIMDIAFDVKNCRRLTIALIKAIDPELASYPFLSRRRTKRKSVNEVTELPLEYFSYNKIKAILPKSLVDFLYKQMGRRFDDGRLNEMELECYSDIIDVKELKKHPNLYSIPFNRLYSVDVVRKALDISIE